MENQIDDQTTKLINKVEKQSSLWILGIIKESLKTTLRNAKRMIAFLLITLYFNSILEAGEHLLSKPIPRPLSSKTKISPPEFWFNALHYATTVFSYVVLLFFSMATLYNTFETHAGKPCSIKDAIFSVKGTWKRVFLTVFYVVLILLGALSIFWMLFKLTPSRPVSDNCVVLTATAKAISYTARPQRPQNDGLGVSGLHPRSCLEMTLGFTVLGVIVYMLAVFGLSLVISAAEEGCEGKKLQAWVLTVNYVLCILGLHLLSKFAKSKMCGVKNWAPQAV